MSIDSSEGLFNQLINLDLDNQLPPFDQWQPTVCGSIDMTIAMDGTWFYAGTPITRQSIVKLFSRVLKKEGDHYFLMTPVEKVSITVEDAPFVVVDMDTVLQGGYSWLVAITNVGDKIVLDEHHCLWMKVDEYGSPIPYIHVRQGLNARITRTVFYRLVENAIHHVHADEYQFFISSGPTVFSLGCFDRSLFD